MVKKVIALLLMVLLLVVSPLIGCSSGGVTNPIELVPKNANVVGHVDLSKILQDNDLTGIYDKVPKDSSYPQTFDDALSEAKDKLGIDPRDFDEIVLFSDTSEATGEDSTANFALIVKGTFNKSDLLNAIETAAEEAEVQLDTTDYKGYEIYTVADEESAFVFLSNTMLAFGPTEWVKDVVDVEKGDAKALSGELLDTYNKLSDALIKVAVAVPPNVGEGKLGESASQYLGDLSAFDKVESVGMTLSKNNESVALDVKLCCADSDSAQSIEQSIDGLITLVKFLMVMSEDQQQNQALDTLLNKVEVGRSDSCVNITVTATLAEIEGLIQSSGQTA
jgi:hypothetical protein